MSAKTAPQLPTAAGLARILRNETGGKYLVTAEDGALLVTVPAASQGVFAGQLNLMNSAKNVAAHRGFIARWVKDSTGPLPVLRFTARKTR